MSECVIKLKINSAFLQSFISGVAKSPENEESICTTFDIDRAMEIELDSEEFLNIVDRLKERGLKFEVVQRA